MRCGVVLTPESIRQFGAGKTWELWFTTKRKPWTPASEGEKIYLIRSNNVDGAVGKQDMYLTAALEATWQGLQEIKVEDLHKHVQEHMLSNDQMAAATGLTKLWAMKFKDVVQIAAMLVPAHRASSKAPGPVTRLPAHSPSSKAPRPVTRTLALELVNSSRQ